MAWLTALAAACGDSTPAIGDGGANCREDPERCLALSFSCGRFQDDDGQCLSCGGCPLPETCGGGGLAHRCGCTPRTCQEQGVQCGEIDDGCGAPTTCGPCPTSEVCIGRMCRPRIELGGDCSTARDACQAGTTCCLVGTGTLCIAPTNEGICPAELPDLSLGEVETRRSISLTHRSFGTEDCALGDGCIRAPGDRHLLRFATQINNVGRATLQHGVPRGNPDFVFDACATHLHYHYADFLTYSLHLRDPDDSPGEMVVEGFKFAHCIEDATPLSPASPARGDFSCSSPDTRQGLSPGWGIPYAANIDCQWLDVTGVPEGDYLLRIIIDPQNKIAEEREDNNTQVFRVSIPAL